jgi:murein DD-endopeptidase MepM/ murein hydrolase activator NlpD
MSVLTRCLLLLAFALLTAPAYAVADDLAVTHRPGPIQPGHVIRLTVTAPPAVSAVTALWQDREVVFVRQPDGPWDALIGIDIADTPGPRSVHLSARQTDGTSLTATHTFRVEPIAVRTRRIRVDPKFVTPPASALPRIREETALLNALFGRASLERRWTADAVRPVDGVAVSGFGVRTILNGQAGGPHNGLDLAAPAGTPIYAPAPGVIAYAREFYYSGNTVIVDHGQGLYSTMAHLSVMEVLEGDLVSKGALIGKVGATGRVTGPHLHWGVRLHGARVDPLSLLDTLAAQPPTP